VGAGHAFTRLTLGYRHTCGLTAAHNVFCWGDNEFGELGRGTSGLGANPTPALVTGSHTFTDVQAGAQHTCGLTTAGEAWCWGANSFGELGLGTRDELLQPTPVHAASGLTFSALASAWGRSCGITAGGHVTCWGYADDTPTEVAGLSGIVRITGGGTYGFCGLDAAGIVSCWGHTEPTVQFLPTVPLTDVTVGTISACALPVAGKAFCWGFNLAFQLGGESESTVDGPVEIIGQP
jgi:alpha-tubulin suppressor-like RCC1 family protein